MPQKKKYAIALTVALGLFMVALDSTIVNVGLIPISKALNTDFNNIQWIFISYLLSNAAVVSLSGYLGNRFGTKRLFLWGLALFILTSLLCGLAENLVWLIGFRVLQGVGGGLMMPLGMALAIQPFAKEERPKAMGLVGVPLLLAPVLGPIIGGLIIDNLNWQTIFFVNLPIGLVALWLSARILPRDHFDQSTHEKFDYAGLVLSTLGVVAVVYAFKLVSETDPATRTLSNPSGDIHGWDYAPVWLLLSVGFFLLGAFAVNSLYISRDPVVDLRQFKRFEFSLGNLIIWLSTVISFGMLSLIPQFLQSVRLPHLSAVDTGLVLVPMGIGTLVGTVLGAGLSRKIGTRWIVVAGGLFYLLGFSQINTLTPTTNGDALWLWLFLLGMSVTLTVIPVQALAIGNLKGAELNKASSLINSTKLLMASVGGAVLVTTLLQQVHSHAAELTPQILASGQRPDQAVLARLAAEAGTRGMNDIFSYLFYTSIGLTVVACFLPGNKADAKTQTDDAETASDQPLEVVGV